ncbi:hypothetical protein BJ508DRAFT_414849 [Ascobolus immersus RN42]|uniref:FAM192A/Fyv6 N-terminal domain-containing protein n=1 Tax=Ascobolus immersus RN42 TaxID=1160509 RepID=A0A3N4I6U5_ASCIM|nr:hypothetical protein BJ508DRAFT_414849 [Ascobolus immersus RN42]
MVGFVPAGTAPPPSSKPTESQPTYLVSNALPQGQSVDENRSLFDILQANKQKKQEEFEEKLKFKNQFRGLEGDEAEFLVCYPQRGRKLVRRKETQKSRELKVNRTVYSNLSAPQRMPGSGRSKKV